MKKCLVTKLKSVVTNDNLEKLGCITLSVAQTSERVLINSFKASDQSSPVVFTLSNGTFYSYGGANLGNNISVTSQVAVYFTAGANCKLEIENYYNLERFEYYGEYISGNSKKFEWAKDIIIFSAYLTGNLKDLGGLTSLTMFITGNTEFSGDYKDLALAQITAGRSTGTIRIGDIANLLTLNGGVVYGTKVDFVWESSTKMFTKGVDSQHISCIGYSDAEIAERTASSGDWEGYQINKRD